MSSAKVENSSSVAKKSAEKTFTSRDVVILCLSFLFTIIVACLILFYLSENQEKNSVEVEKIVEKILDARGFKRDKNGWQSFDGEGENVDKTQEEDSLRQKRAVYESRSTHNGESCERGQKAKRSITHKFLSKAEQSIVEFFNPNLKTELEKNDTELMKRTGLKGAAPRGDSWADVLLQDTF